MSNHQLVYLDPNFNTSLQQVFNEINGKEALLISDNYTDQRFIMINLIDTEEKKLKFEINRANILNQGLLILPDMVLAGGSEVDVAKLYKASQDSMFLMQSEIRKMRTLFDSLRKNIAKSQSLIELQQGELETQQLEIDTKQQTVNAQRLSLEQLKSDVKLSENILEEFTSSLNKREKDLEVLQEEIAEQSAQLNDGSVLVQDQLDKIKAQEDVIAQGEKNIDELTVRFANQRQTIWLLILFSLIVLASLILILRAYFLRRQFVSRLQEQKEELTKLLAELNATQSQLVQSEKMASLGVLTAGIAHEINNAINFVYSGIQILSNSYSDIRPILTNLQEIKAKNGTSGDLKIDENIDLEESVNYIDQMIESIVIGAERTTDIVKGLRTFSRSEDENQTEIDVHEDLEVALLLLNSRIKNVIDIKKGLKATNSVVRGYKGQLSQALLNFISNSIDAINERNESGEIKITTESTADKIKVSICDNGGGIEPSVLAKIYDPFFTTKEIGKGTGLGLSIAYGIIERHKGVISVNSVVNKGTTFIIELPLMNVR